MTKTRFEEVAEFHDAFGHPIKPSPATPEVARIKLRLNLILEEVRELVEAQCSNITHKPALSRVIQMLNNSKILVNEAKDYEFNPDLVATADALGDINYVVNGAGLEYGIDLDAVGEEIHSSNMTKLGEDGEPIYNEDGKVMKGPNYREPDIAAVLAVQQAEYEASQEEETVDVMPDEQAEEEEVA